jgi:hypothetical protein
MSSLYRACYVSIPVEVSSYSNVMVGLLYHYYQPY